MRKGNRETFTSESFWKITVVLLVVWILVFLAAALVTAIELKLAKERSQAEYSRGFSDCKQQGVGEMKEFIQKHTSCLVKTENGQAMCKIVLNYGTG